MGLKREQEGVAAVKAEAPGCYPENWPAFRLFAALSTQWRLAPGGEPIGLRYEAMPPLLDLMQFDRIDRADLLPRLQLMEKEALQLFGEKHGQ